MSKNLVIVESPAKAKTIEKYLGKEFTVIACYGHVRDLPSGTMGVDLKTFEPEYSVMSDKKKIITELKKESKKAEFIWLATDPDREGEAIAWHVQKSMNLPDEKFKRIVFNEITKDAVLKSINSPRTIDVSLVNSQQARRILDRIVGYEMSPILWKKLKRGLSAGRVQSVAVKIIVEREKEIGEYEVIDSYKVTAEFLFNGTTLEAELNKEFENIDELTNYLESLNNQSYEVSNVEQKDGRRSPSAPFTTSSLQQEASSRLGYSVSRTMILAQRLYEEGHITYMRTDGTTLSNDAKKSIEKYIIKNYGENYFKAKDYQTKVKGAQEAHEAVRPTDINVTDAGSDDSEKKLYRLIRQRTLASQMSPASILKTTVEIPANDYIFQAKGEVVSFDGFLKVYPTSAKDKLLPEIKIGDLVNEQKIQGRQKFSRPPARYTEASLVRKLEELGIGRPSTYAPTITTIQKREYVERIEEEGKTRDVCIIERKNNEVSKRIETENYGNDRGKLQPTDIGTLVTDYLDKHFDRVMSYEFTAEIESEFDLILTNEINWTDMLKSFYEMFHPKIEKAESEEDRINEERNLGNDPKTGKTVFAKIGKYGPFVQLGENEDEEKRSVSLKKGLKYSTVTFEEALDVLEYPMQLGDYMDEPVSINIGRYGVYLKHGKRNYSMKDRDISLLEDAIELIEEAKKEQANKEIHVFQHESEDLKVLNGKYGPYISFKKKNFKIPKDTNPESLTLDACIQIIESAPKGRKTKRKKK